MKSKAIFHIDRFPTELDENGCASEPLQSTHCDRNEHREGVAVQAPELNEPSSNLVAGKTKARVHAAGGEYR